MEKTYKYPLLIFLLWITSPLIILATISLFNKIIIDPKSSLINLLIPGIVFSVIAFGITRIKDHSLRIGSFYALIGALLWSSPAIYFLPSTAIYSSTHSLGRFLFIILPTTLLSLIFFVIGKTKASPQKDLTDLYIDNRAFRS